MNIFTIQRKSQTALRTFFSGFLMLALVSSQVALPLTALAQTTVCPDPVTQTIVSDGNTNAKTIETFPGKDLYNGPGVKTTHPPLVYADGVTPFPNPWALIDGATWIWNTELIVFPKVYSESEKVSEKVLFTKTFTVAGTPTEAKLQFAADNAYSIKVNGTIVDEQINLNISNYTTLHEFDIAPLLIANEENILEVTVINQAYWTVGYTPHATDGEDQWGPYYAAGKENPAGLIYKLDVTSQPDCTPSVGSIEITKYDCPTDTVIVRSIHGIDGSRPEGCVLAAGKTFGYVHGAQTDNLSPYLELEQSLTPGGATGADGILLISNLPATGRYLIAETNAANQKLAQNEILGLICEGDSETSDTNNDNQELTFVPAGGIARCVAYNVESTDIEEPKQCDIVSDTTNLTETNAPAVETWVHPSWADATVLGGAAKWIWTSFKEVNPETEKTHIFTKKFTVTGTTAATFQMAADNTPTVVINGTTVPVVLNGEEFNYGTITTPIDVSTYLVDGVNTISISVKNLQKDNVTPETNPGGLLYKLNVKAADCSDSVPSTTLKVYVHKYLRDSQGIHQIANGAVGVPAAFPMQSTWNASNIGSGTATYGLGNAQGGAAFDYAAVTSSMSAPADYTTQEITDGSVVVAADSLSCPAGKYRLVGYRTGNSLVEAETAVTIIAAPVFTDITTDKYVIVVNEYCGTGGGAGNLPPVVDAGPAITVTSNVATTVANSGATASDPEAGVLTYLWTGPDGAVISSPATLVTDFSNLAPGSYTFTLTVTDNGGLTASDTILVTVNPIVTGGGGGGGLLIAPTPQVLGASTAAPVGQVLGASTECGLYLKEYLKVGRKNNAGEVRKLQIFLNDYLKLDPKLPVTGIFGPLTQKAVVKFQEGEKDLVLAPWVGLTLKSAQKGTGWVFKTTTTRINNIMCPTLNLQNPPLNLAETPYNPL